MYKGLESYIWTVETVMIERFLLFFIVFLKCRRWQ